MGKNLNWYKTTQQKPITEQYPFYQDIGHIRYQKDYAIVGKVSLWMSNLDGSNFSKKDLKGPEDTYDHSGLAYDTGFDMGTGIIQGRYDKAKNVVSLSYNPRIVTMKYLPNRLIDRLKKEFGENVKILDYSRGSPQVVV